MFGLFKRKKAKRDLPVEHAASTERLESNDFHQAAEGSSKTQDSASLSDQDRYWLDWLSADLEEIEREIDRIRSGLVKNKGIQDINRLQEIQWQIIERKKAAVERKKKKAAAERKEAAARKRQRLASKAAQDERLQKIRNKKEQERIKSEKLQMVRSQRDDKLKTCIQEHLPALRRNIMRSIHVNEYGAVEHDGSAKEFERFLVSCGFKIEGVNWINGTIKSKNFISKQKFRGQLTALKKRFKREDSVRHDRSFDPKTIPSDGHEFEHWVSEQLQKFGWDCKVSQGSGDQGIDVLASKQGVSVGIQCKLYSGNVGNKAVQEAHAGIGFYEVSQAVVLTNSKYTPSAEKLAMSLGVLLLSHHDIPAMFDLIKSFRAKREQ